MAKKRRVLLDQEGEFKFWFSSEHRIPRKKKKHLKRLDADQVMTLLIEEVWRRRG